MTTGTPFARPASPSRAHVISSDALDRGLARLSRARVFLGHRSVGSNILHSLGALLSARGDRRIQIVETTDPSRITPGTIAHGLLGRNGDARSKIGEFAGLLASPLGTALDIALMKLCYVDVGAGTDVPALLALYAAAIHSAAQLRPRLAILHVAVPLTSVQRGWRAGLKRALCISPGRLEDNAVRDDFNMHLRARFGGRVFDLAGIEANGPDGRRERHLQRGRLIPALAPASTHDGFHLNDAGGRLVATRLVCFLADHLEAQI